MQAGDYGVEITFTPTVGTGFRNLTGATVVQLVTISPVTHTRKVFDMTPSDDGTYATYTTVPNDFPASEYGTYQWQVQAQYGSSPFIQTPLRPLYVGQSI